MNLEIHEIFGKTPSEFLTLLLVFLVECLEVVCDLLVGLLGLIVVIGFFYVVYDCGNKNIEEKDTA